MRDTRYSPATISEMTEGQIVQGQNGYSRVKTCVHGNLYYAYMGQDMMDAGVSDADDVALVSDDDTHELECCK